MPSELDERSITPTVGPHPDLDQDAGFNFLHVAVKAQREPRLGIFMKGSCDLPSMYVMAPLIRERLLQNGRGSCCIHLQGNGASDARPDILLQTLDDIPADLVDDVTSSKVLDGGESVDDGPGPNLAPEYFEPRLFEPTFSVPDNPELGVFPKTVVVLSVAPGLARSAYQHRTKGYLVDPGGFWLNESMSKVLADGRRAAWFKENFRNVGKLSVDEFYESFGRVILTVRERTGAHVLVMSSLVVDPKSPLHNFQFAGNSLTVRRRRFDVALRRLSAELDFPIVDVDRILKREGIDGQVDAGHFPTERMKPIAAEGFRILDHLGVLSP